MPPAAVSATVIVLALVASVSAQSSRARVDMRFAPMDANGDRVITRGEWRGTEASFNAHDWNRDGRLSGNEVRMRAWRPQRAAAPPDLEGADHAHVFGDWTLAGFYRLDHDGNARIEPGEWHFDREAFHRVDHDRDGALSRDEFLGRARAEDDDDRDDTFSNLDGDGDGRVSRVEWHGGGARFAALDTNGDGALTREEVTGASSPIPDLFTSLDVNGDTVLTRNEWHWSLAAFEARDTNDDGRMTREEAAAGGGAPAPQAQAHRDGYERGLEDGRAAGRRDRERGIDFNLDGRSELSTGDPSYQGDLSTRVAYQAGYREGFRRGYREAFPPQ
jgi:Ca2+-binding EF-hand superfamily protein